MNLQSPGIEWAHAGTGRGYTWNPVGGCKHECRWVMPDGATAICYAETVASRVARGAYPNGFAAHYWRPEKLHEPLSVEQPSGIFVDSMSDLMGHWVDEEQILMVIEAMRAASRHTFILLTKNPRRLLNFEFPDNVWCLASMPPDMFMGKHLTSLQQEVMLKRWLGYLQQLKAQGRAKVIGLSAEPLSWDISPVLYNAPDLDWVIIGAASNGRTIHQPDSRIVCLVEDWADWNGTAVFHKGNIRPAVRRVREEFPVAVK